jgi:hypothetical protein
VPNRSHFVMKIVPALLLLAGALHASDAQSTLPQVDIYVADLTGPGCPCAPVNLTHRAGYDNQPHFLPDGAALIYTADDESGTTNIYRLTLATGERTRVTATPESEFSPSLMPDRTQVSVVRIEPDLSQHLWRFPLPRQARDPAAMNFRFHRVLEAPEPVGYHVWLDVHTLVLFVLGEPNALYLADAATGKYDRIIGPIGRSLHRIPGTNRASFVDLAAGMDTHIRSFDPATLAIEDLVRPLRSGDVDYAWTPDGRIVMAQEGALFVWDPKSGGAWLPFADFTRAGLKNITRLAFSPDGKRIALVAAD